MTKLSFPSLDGLPTPLAARTAAGLTQEEVRRSAKIGIMTVVRSERQGRWPKDYAVLRSYLRAVGLAK